VKAPAKSLQAEFSRPLNVAGLGQGKNRLNLEATAAERSDLAEQFGILALDSLSADIVLTVDDGGDGGDGGRQVKAVGRLKARVVQVCVVSLEPLTTTIDAAFERLFVEGAGNGPDGWEGGPEDVEIHLEHGQKDPPDSMTGGLFDLGEAVAEQLALEIPQFPRAEKAVFEGNPAEAGPKEGREGEKTKGDNPFAALEKLRTGGA
jgi:uncharacterized metal-binding protein YceD (DUF177 family)